MVEQNAVFQEKVENQRKNILFEEELRMSTQQKNMHSVEIYTRNVYSVKPNSLILCQKESFSWILYIELFCD